MTIKIQNPKIFTVQGGFYFFGDEVNAPEGYLALKNLAMFRNFSGERGLPGVARGCKDAKVTLDRFIEDEISLFPISAIFAVHTSINLYTFNGATVYSD